MMKETNSNIPRSVLVVKPEGGEYGFELVGNGPVFLREITGVAAEAGICPGDRVVSINHVDVSIFDHDSVVNLIRRAEGGVLQMLLVQDTGSAAVLQSEHRSPQSGKPDVQATPSTPSRVLSTPLKDQSAHGRNIRLGVRRASSGGAAREFRVTLVGTQEVEPPAGRWTMEHLSKIVAKFSKSFSHRPPNSWIRLTQEDIVILNSHRKVVCTISKDSVNFCGTVGGNTDRLALVSNESDQHTCRILKAERGRAPQLVHLVSDCVSSHRRSHSVRVKTQRTIKKRLDSRARSSDSTSSEPNNNNSNGAVSPQRGHPALKGSKLPLPSPSQTRKNKQATKSATSKVSSEKTQNSSFGASPSRLPQYKRTHGKRPLQRPPYNGGSSRPSPMPSDQRDEASPSPIIIDSNRGSSKSSVAQLEISYSELEKGSALAMHEHSFVETSTPDLGDDGAGTPLPKSPSPLNNSGGDRASTSSASLLQQAFTGSILPQHLIPAKDLDLSPSPSEFVPMQKNIFLTSGTIRRKQVFLYKIGADNPELFDEELNKTITKLKSFSRPNLARFVGLSVDGYNESGYIFACWSLAKISDSLATVLAEKHHPWAPRAPSDVLGMSREIAGGLAFLHENGVVHGFLCPYTIHVSTTGALRLCGFGLSSITEYMQEVYFQFKSFVDPNMLSSTNPKPSEKADVFSAGQIFGELASRARLDEAHELRPLVSSCIAENVDARPRASALYFQIVSLLNDDSSEEESESDVGSPYTQRKFSVDIQRQGSKKKPSGRRSIGAPRGSGQARSSANNISTKRKSVPRGPSKPPPPFPTKSIRDKSSKSKDSSKVEQNGPIVPPPFPSKTTKRPRSGPPAGVTPPVPQQEPIKPPTQISAVPSYAKPPPPFPSPRSLENLRTNQSQLTNTSGLAPRDALLDISTTETPDIVEKIDETTAQLESSPYSPAVTTDPSPTTETPTPPDNEKPVEAHDEKVEENTTNLTAPVDDSNNDADDSFDFFALMAGHAEQEQEKATIWSLEAELEEEGPIEVGDKTGVELWKMGFRFILQDDKAFELFQKFLKTIKCDENAMFWKASLSLKDCPENEVAEVCKDVHTRFVKDMARYCINIKPDTRNKITDLVKNESFVRTMFSPALKEVYYLMRTDSYPRFLESPIFKSYEEAPQPRMSDDENRDLQTPEVESPSVLDTSSSTPNSDKKKKKRWGTRKKK
eukprot:m.76260 g.76260  ORF g.76260 m.76260 type:complete len:1205 (-) comp12547_c0_seq5:28-3642(-)